VWNRVNDLLDDRGSRWKTPEQKLFRIAFTQTDPEANPVSKSGRRNDWEPDPDLRDFENVALKRDIGKYVETEVLPHVPDAWWDKSKDKIGYEINFNRYFFKYVPPRRLEDIDSDLKRAEAEIMRLLNEVTI